MPIEIPAHLERIFNQPGRQWTEENQKRVVRWLFEPAQLNYLLRFCMVYLGSYARSQDAEDAWGDFCSTRLFSVIRLYDPEKGRQFWNYLLFCLQRECMHQGKRITQKNKIEHPLEVKYETGQDEFILTYEPIEPDMPSIQADARDLVEALEACLNGLPSHHQNAFALVVLQELDYNQASEMLSEIPSTIRVWVHRARAAIKRCLIAKGWNL